MLIKRAKRFDDELLKKFLKLTKEWENEYISFDWCADSVDYLKNKIVFVAKLNNELVGFLYGKIKRNKNLPFFKKKIKYCDLEAIYVRKQYRCLGIGKMLLDNFIKYCVKHRVKYIYVVTDNKNTAYLIKFYSNVGFEIVQAKLIKKLK